MSKYAYYRRQNRRSGRKEITKEINSSVCNSRLQKNVLPYLPKGL